MPAQWGHGYDRGGGGYYAAQPKGYDPHYDDPKAYYHSDSDSYSYSSGGPGYPQAGYHAHQQPPASHAHPQAHLQTSAPMSHAGRPPMRPPLHPSSSYPPPGHPQAHTHAHVHAHAAAHAHPQAHHQGGGFAYDQTGAHTAALPAYQEQGFGAPHQGQAPYPLAQDKRGAGYLPPSPSSAAAFSPHANHGPGQAGGPGGYASAQGGQLVSERGAKQAWTEEKSHMEYMDKDVDDIFSFARHNRVDEVERLLDRGIPVNVRDDFGNTILTVSCQNGHKRVAKAALRRGADINARNYKGNTPLHFCFTYGYGDTLGQYIISKGGDTTVRNDAGLTCFEGLGR